MSLFDIKMPKLGESVTEGTIISLNVKLGQMVEEDDVLFEVNTAKVSAEIPSPVEGVVKEILCKEGDTIAVGEVVARIDLSGELSGENTEDNTTKETSSEDSETASGAETSIEEKSSDTVKLGKKSGDRWYSPVVLQKAKAAKIDKAELDSIQGTGFQGRLTKHDITLYIEQQNGAPKPDRSLKENPSIASPRVAAAASSSSVQDNKITVPVKIGEGDTVIPMDAVRKIIADRMTESKHVSPHVTNVIEVDVTKLVNWRNREKENFKKREGVSLTFMAPIIEASVKALKDFPRVNSSVDGYNIVERKDINIGMAVSLPDGNLIVPVIKQADRLSMSGLALAVSEKAQKARSNKLGMDEIEGGSFTITNFGSFNSLFGTPIINQPEVAILGVGVIKRKPVVLNTEEGETIAIRDMMYLSLSFDHRIIDGMLGGRFLERVAKYLEEWEA